MTDRFIETHIRQLPIFAKIPDQYIIWVVEAFRVLRVEAGEYLFTQGQPTQGFYMVLTGQAQLLQKDPATGQMQQTAIIGENQYLNENALFQQGEESASLRAMQSTTLLFLSRQRFMDALAHHPEIKLYLPKDLITERIQRREQVFRGQRPNEIVLLDTRRHWWAFVRKAWQPMLIALIMVIIASLLPAQFQIVTYALDFLAIIIHFPVMLYYYLEWRNDHVIITDQRIIHIEREILTFRSRVSEIPIASVQAVNADNITIDPFSRILEYGTLEIKTPGDAGNMTLTIIPKPEDIQELIFANRNRQQEQQEAEKHQIVRATVDKVLGRQTSEHPIVQQPDEPAQFNKTPPGGFWLLLTRFSDEKGRTVYRKNFIYWLRLTIVPGLLLMTSFVLMLLMIFVPDLQTLNPIGPLFMFFLMLVFGIWFYLMDWDWRHDLYIVGDETIQITHMRPLWLQDENDQVLLESVDNVVSEQSGILQTMFNYGNVRIFLVGADANNAKVFSNVSAPKMVQAEITRRQARYRQKKTEAEERKRRSEIEAYLSVYHETVSGEQGQATQPEAVPGSNYFYPDAGQNIPVAATPQPWQNHHPHTPAHEEPLEGYHLNRTVYDRVRPPKIPRLRQRV